MNFILLDQFVVLSLAFKFAVTVILFLAYISSKNKIFIWWSLGWLLLTSYSFCDHLLLFVDYKIIWFLRNMAYAFSSVFFLCSICLLLNKKNYFIYLLFLGIASFFSAYIGLYLYDSWFWSAFPASMINGSILIISGYYYYKTVIDKKIIYNRLITLGFILIGLHNLDYPFLRNVEWFAPIGFLLATCFSLIFGLGMILKYEFEINRQRKVNLEHIRELATLYTITSTVCRSRKLDQILYSVLDNVLRVLRLDAGVVFLLDKKTGNLLLKAHRGHSKRFVEKFSKLSTKNTMPGKAIEENKIIFIEDVSKLTDPRKEILIDEGIHGGIVIPLRSSSRVLGILIFWTRKTHKYTSQDVRLLDSIGNELGVAMDNKLLAEDLEMVYLQTILTLADIVETKDHYTRSHSNDVTRYAVMIAQELNLNEKEVEKIRMASQLHDLGKIGISDFILLKKGKLNEEEWKEVKKHPERAVEILKPLTFLHKDNGVLEYIRSHHERHDGKGYPNGLKGDQIKLGAKILSVADSFHAMISVRPYRNKPLTLEEAKEELKVNAGLQFDPKVVDAFLRAWDKRQKSKESY